MSGFFDQHTAKLNAAVTNETHEELEIEQRHEAIVTGTASHTDVNIHVERTDARLRDAVKDLLKNGLIEADAKPNLYRTATVEHEALIKILEPMDLTAAVDEVRGLVFLAVRKNGSDVSEEDDDWSHTLIRKQRLNLEQSLLVAVLRQIYVIHEQDAGVGGASPVIAIDEVVTQLQLYLGESGSEQKDRNRALQLLDQLKGYGLVTAPDSHDRVTIRPIITHLANPENLKALQHALKERLSKEKERNE